MLTILRKACTDMQEMESIIPSWKVSSRWNMDNSFHVIGGKGDYNKTGGEKLILIYLFFFSFKEKSCEVVSESKLGIRNKRVQKIW